MSRVADPSFAFSVVITATDRDVLARAAASVDDLPRYGSGLRWTAAEPTAAMEETPDLAITLCDAAADIPKALRVASIFASTGCPVIVLTRPGTVTREHRVDGGLIVAAPTPDVVSGVVTLAHVTLASVHAYALADLDWADVRTVMAQGSHGALFDAWTPSPTGTGDEPVAQVLATLIAATRHGRATGACGVVSLPAVKRFGSWHALLRGLDGEDRLIAVGLADVDGSRAETYAGVLVVTQP